jgi:hypothetical protein
MKWRWRYSSIILDLGTRRVVSFTPLPLYLWGKSSSVPIDLKARWAGRCEVEKNLLALPGIKPRLRSRLLTLSQNNERFLPDGDHNTNKRSIEIVFI